MQLVFILATLMALAISPCSSTRCFLQPSLGGVPNESSSPLLCTLVPTSSQEIPIDIPDGTEVIADSAVSDDIDVDADSFVERLGSAERDILLQGRAGPPPPEHKFMRFGRDLEHKFLRFGREPQHNFMRFGRDPQHNFLRFGRSVENNAMRGKNALPLFMRLGRGPEHVFMRFGRQQAPQQGHKFMRFGRTPPADTAAQPTSAEKGSRRK